VNLTDHFTLAELTVSETAARKGLDNTPPPEIIEVLRRTAQGLERIRALLGKPLHVNSGYRSEAVERDLTAAAYAAWCLRHGRAQTEESWQAYFAGKQHPKGEAADITCSGMPVRELAQLIADKRFDLGVDQVILEFGSWAHVSFTENPRHAILTIDQGGTRTGLA
jgi:hypothetical protein